MNQLQCTGRVTSASRRSASAAALSFTSLPRDAADAALNLTARGSPVDGEGDVSVCGIVFRRTARFVLSLWRSAETLSTGECQGHFGTL